MINKDKYLKMQQRTYVDTKRELLAGEQSSCWFWWTFPVLSGMEFSVKTEKYSLSGVAEALEYYSEPTLGRRLSECLELLLALDEPLEEVFGELNAIKLHSCLTLFCCAVEIKNSLFEQALAKFFDGQYHQPTYRRLKR